MEDNSMRRGLAAALVMLAATGCTQSTPAPAATQPKAATTKEASESKATSAEGTPPEVRLPSGIPAATGAVATVNGRDIPADRFNRELARLVGTGVRVPADRVKHIARNILNRQIEDELRQQAIARRQLKLTDAEFDEAYQAYTSRYMDAEGHFDEARFQASLKRNNVTLDQLKARVRRERLARKLVETLGNVTVTEAELKAFYDNNNNSWIEDESRDVRPLLVRCPPNPPPAEEQACKTQANTVFQRLSRGDDFETVAAETKDFPPRAPLHLTRSSSEVDLARAAFTLKVGQVHAPVRTRKGYMVIRLIEKNDSRVRSFDELRDEIGKRLRERKYYLEGIRIVRELRQKAKVVTRLPM